MIYMVGKNGIKPVYLLYLGNFGVSLQCSYTRRLLVYTNTMHHSKKRLLDLSDKDPRNPWSLLYGGEGWDRTNDLYDVNVAL